jgi:hypothetical protein
MNYVFLAVTVFKQIGVVYLISKQFTKKRALLKYQSKSYFHFLSRIFCDFRMQLQNKL